jgi:uracil-DNA glycosylase
MLTSYIIQNNLKDSVSDILKEIDLNNPDLLTALKSVALINVKKIPGNTSANPSKIAEAYKKNKHILKEQIEVYNPNIVICGNTLQYFSEDNYFVKKDRTRLEHGNHHYYPLTDRLYLQTYHPAYKSSDRDFEIKYIDKIVQAVNNWKSTYRKV